MESQDIPDRCRESWRTPSAWGGRRGSDVGGCHLPVSSSPLSSSRAAAPSRSPATTTCRRAWVYELVARYRAEGDAAFEPRSRRPHTSPRATAVGDRRADRRSSATSSSRKGLDAGADTIGWHLEHHHQLTVSRATIYRILRRPASSRPSRRNGRARPTSASKPTSPTRRWQADFTHCRLADGTDVEILSWIDDHSRYALSVTAHRRVTGPIVVDTFTQRRCHDHGIPASTLTDNGMVFTTRLVRRQRRPQRLRSRLDRLGIIQKNSRPNHPTTCGKVERFHQTLKSWLTAPDPAPPPSPSCKPSRPLRRRLQPPPPTPLTPTPATPAAAYTSPTQSHTPGTPPTPTTASATTASTTPATSPCASTATCTTSALGRPPPRNPHHHAHRRPRRPRHPRHHRRNLRHLTIDPTRRYHGTGHPPADPQRTPKTKPAEP